LPLCPTSRQRYALEDAIALPQTGSVRRRLAWTLWPPERDLRSALRWCT